jgi:hypothetical protein
VQFRTIGLIGLQVAVLGFLGCAAATAEYLGIRPNFTSQLSASLHAVVCAYGVILCIQSKLS